MKIQIKPEVMDYLNYHGFEIIKVAADHECVGANCSDAFTFPILSFDVPKQNEMDKYDVFDVNGITVFYDKDLETIPEVIIAREHHLINERIIVQGYKTPPRVTHNKL